MLGWCAEGERNAVEEGAGCDRYRADGEGKRRGGAFLCENGGGEESEKDEERSRGGVGAAHRGRERKYNVFRTSRRTRVKQKENTKITREQKPGNNKNSVP